MTTTAKYGDDGFRTETCERCGEKIGYSFFDAREADGRVWFTHRDQATYEFPAWCQKKEG